MIEKQDLLPNATIGNLNDDHKFLQDNEFIHAGYRLYFNSFRKICRSLFMWHNESFNIWSHLLGFMLFLSFLVYSVFFLKLNGEISLFSAGNDAFGQAFQVVKSFEHVSQDIKSEIDSERFDWILPRLLNTRLQPVSRWPLFVFILSAMICLSMSTVYHLFSAHSRRIYALTSRLDYAGISILIAGSFFPPIYYIYFCREGLIILYLSGITFFCGLVFIVSLLPSFQKPKFRCLRGSVFLVLGLTALIPCINLYFISDTGKFSSGLYCYLWMALCYIFGVLIYILRFPERFIPGKLDYIGNSHNIWHLFVLSACIFHYLGAIDNYYSRQHLLC